MVRQVRMVMTNARIYEAGHAQRSLASEGLWNFLLELHEDLGVVLVEVVSWGVLINGKGLETADKGASIVTEWFQRRAVRNFVFDGRGRMEDLCEQLDLLADLDEDSLAQFREGNAPGALNAPPLIFNVIVESSEPQKKDEAAGRTSSGFGRKTTAMSGLAPGDSEAPVELDEKEEPGNDEGASLQAPRADSEVAGDELAEAGAEDGEEGKAEAAKPDRFSWATVAIEALDDSLEQLLAEAEGDQQVLATMGTRALQSVLDRGAEAVLSYLAQELPTRQAAQRLRGDLLVALQQSDELRVEVLGGLAQRLGELASSEGGEALGSSLVQACEELVPAAINCGELHTVAAFSSTLEDLSAGSSQLAVRAGSARLYLSSPQVIAMMVRKMEVLPRDQCELIRSILRSFSEAIVPQLLELLMTAERRSVRASLVEVIVYHLRAAVAADADSDELLAPFLRELANASDNPWYVTRNLVSILSQVNTPTCQRQLLALVNQDQDPRVLTELARGLMQTEAESARRLLQQLAFDRRFTDGAGLFDVVRYLYSVSAAAVLRGLEKRLAEKDVSAPVAEGSLLGLAYSAGEEAVPFLSRLLTEKAGLLKRPVYADSVRSAALEAMATIRGKKARGALALGREDKESEIRRRTVELVHMEPSRASVAAYRRLGVDPNGND